MYACFTAYTVHTNVNYLHSVPYTYYFLLDVEYTLYASSTAYSVQYARVPFL